MIKLYIKVGELYVSYATELDYLKTKVKADIIQPPHIQGGGK